MQAYPDARSYRNKTVLDYNNLCLIYENVTPNGKDTHSGVDADLIVDDDILLRKTGRFYSSPRDSEIRIP